MEGSRAPTPSSATRPTAFVDASVIAAYLAGEEAASQLFVDGYSDRVRFAVDPVVLQEILVLPQLQESPELLERVEEGLKFEVLPLDLERSEHVLERAKALRNRIVHSSGVLVVASAADCDYLITYDSVLKELVEGDRPIVVTPEEFAFLVAAR